MRLLRKQINLVAAFLLVNFMANIAYPTVSYALTSGPTAPEATSFEPVDATDMVDMATGDFTYNIPLLEVPGPAGGYPLSLSYHANVTMGMEASWVGLGWSLNPGAINRFVNGFPDDWRNVKNVSRDYWKGGETRSLKPNVSVGAVGSPASVAHSSEFAFDSNRGFSYGASVHAGVNLLGKKARMKHQNLGLSGSVGYAPFGGGVHKSGGVTAGIGLGEYKATRVSSMAGFTNFGGGNAFLNGGISSLGQTVSGTTLSSSGSSGSHSSFQIGAQSISNSKAGKVSTNIADFELPPISLGGDAYLNLGLRYVRYWVDELDEVYVSGAMNFPNSSVDFDIHEYDAYRIMDPQSYEKHSIGNELDEVLGGSFVNYDNFSVHAQGIYGSFRPNHFITNISRRNKFADNDDDPRTDYVLNYELGYRSDKPNFRFNNDFSNRYEFSPPNFTTDDVLSYSFDGSMRSTGESGSDGYISAENILIGSNNIKYYSYIDGKPDDFVRPDGVSSFSKYHRQPGTSHSVLGSQIEGFIMTNNSGVKYHFNLPAYEYNEYQYTRNINDDDKFNDLKKNEPYAYTWYLTAVTGPDYVDRGEVGLDNDDWGYWVEMSYGQWSGHYAWRGPETGYEQDIDANFESRYSGVREVYYLDAIRTATHTALFIKDVRRDAKSVTSSVNGGFIPKLPRESRLEEPCLSTEKEYPVSTLRLNEILLLKNDGLLSLSDLRNSATENLIPEIQCDAGTRRLDNHFEQNVIDIKDGLATLRTLSIGGYLFEHDYSLVPQTPNSLLNSQVYTNDPLNNPSTYTLGGKLTLKSLNALSKSGASLLPSFDFSYVDNNPRYKKGATDIWGMYKPDYVSTGNENLDRITTPLATSKVDAWLLKKVTTSLGTDIEMDYESDNYRASVLRSRNLLPIRKVSRLKENEFKFETFNNSFDTNELLNNPDISSDLVLKLFFTENYGTDVGDIYCEGFVDINNRGAIQDLEPNTFSFNREDINVLESGAGFFTILSPEIEEMYARRDTWRNYSFCSQCINEFNDDVTDISLRRTKTPVFESGNIIYSSDKLEFGGGIRAKSISVRDNFTSKENITKYSYKDGKVPYTPIALGQVDFKRTENFYYNLTGYENCRKEVLFEAIKEYKAEINAFKDMMYVPTEIPSPNVIYGKVEKREYASKNGIESKLPGYSVYEFETFNEGMVNFKVEDQTSSDGGLNAKVFEGTDREKTIDKRRFARKYLKDYSSRIGRNKRITYYNDSGKKLYETINHYLHDGVSSSSLPDANDPDIEDLFEKNVKIYEPRLQSMFNNLGVVHESFVEGRVVKLRGEKYDLLGIVSKKEHYPAIMIGQSNIDHRLGIITSDHTMAFDFYSGAPTVNLHKDGNGNLFIQEKVPAYKKYPSMGPSAILGNKNMLIQEAAQYSYKVGQVSDKASPVIGSTLLLDHDGALNHLDLEADGVELIDENVSWIYTGSRRDLDYINREAISRFEKGERMFLVYDPVSKNKYLYQANLSKCTTFNTNFCEFEGEFKLEVPDNNTYENLELYSVPQNIFYKKGLVAADVQTWHDNINSVNGFEPDQAPKKHKTYSYQGVSGAPMQSDGTYLISGANAFSEFVDWSNSEPSANSGWQKQSEITLVDRYSHVLEVKDINGDYAATKMSFDQTQVYATAANASYGEFAYSGVEGPLQYISAPTQEYILGGGVSSGNVRIENSGFAHTGDNYITVNESYTEAFRYKATNLQKDRKYLIRVWSTENAAYTNFFNRVVGGAGQFINQTRTLGKVNMWYLIEAEYLHATTNPTMEFFIKPTRNSSDPPSFEGTSYDDFRFQPADVAMTSYVYDDVTGELRFVLDNNNLFTEYRYDIMGRLASTHSESFEYGVKKVSETTTKYANHD